ncbi:MAG TPA: tRNA (adenosine(37)-N6)-threonylcarbamoyltransferase complex ATPase subunit type 1 TsaE [Crenalkalicoccus sp.]|nr:tRNA (adenosine(37)-N6)-threonylcarbamoyltransferase complex ATPase subunit type 1 TsaE [Crenalkalicoccus sp.]
MTLRLADLSATGRLAESLAPAARPGDALLLEGPLGAGKTSFARAFLRRLAGDPGLEVPSPSYTLVQAYDLPGGGEAQHFDLYRLDGPTGLTELGWEEARRGIVLVEWPDRLGALRPADEGALTVALDFRPEAGEGARTARLAGWPGRLAAALEPAA